MTDENGRTLHIGLKKPHFGRNNSRFLLPAVGFVASWITDDNPEHERTRYLREETTRYRLCIAWWCWQFNVAIAEWTDDRTDEEVGAGYATYETPKKVEDSQL